MTWNISGCKFLSSGRPTVAISAGWPGLRPACAPRTLLPTLAPARIFSQGVGWCEARAISLRVVPIRFLSGVLPSQPTLPMIRNSRSLRNACSLLCIVLIVLFLERKIGVSHFWISKVQFQTAVSSFPALISGIPVHPCDRSAFVSIWFPASGGENVQGTTPNYKRGILRRFMNGAGRLDRTESTMPGVLAGQSDCSSLFVSCRPFSPWQWRSTPGLGRVSVDLVPRRGDGPLTQAADSSCTGESVPRLATGPSVPRNTPGTQALTFGSVRQRSGHAGVE
jgi:hypothetical protein